MTAGGIAVSAVGSLGSRFGRLEWVSLAFALLWSTVLVFAAFRLPTYHSLSASGSSLPSPLPAATATYSELS